MEREEREREEWMRERGYGSSRAYWVVDCFNERLNADKLLAARTFCLPGICPSRIPICRIPFPIPHFPLSYHSSRFPQIPSRRENRWFVMVIFLFSLRGCLKANWLMVFQKRNACKQNILYTLRGRGIIDMSSTL